MLDPLSHLLQVLRHKWVKSGPLWQESLALDPFVMRVHPVTGKRQQQTSCPWGAGLPLCLYKSQSLPL